ncbi:MAG: O-antigen ligase family protein [Oligosphaeraceae bacterium]
MKYLIFTLAVLGVPPAAVALSLSRRWLWLAPMAIFPTLLLFSDTAINFFSHELYRGSSRGMEVSLVHLVALAMLGALTLRRGLLHPLPYVGLAIYLVYFLLCLPSTLNAANGLFAFFELWKMTMIYLVGLAIYHYLDFVKGDTRVIYTALAFVTVLIFFSCIRQHYAGVYRIRTYFAHSNSLSMFISPLGTLFLSRFLNDRNRRASLIALVLCAFASATLLRTYSRGAIACYPIGCAITAFASIACSWNVRKLLRLAFLAAIAVLGVAIMVPRIIERYHNAPESSAGTRVRLATIALNMIRDEPVFGVGINNWGIKVNPPYPYSDLPDDNPSGTSRRRGEDVKDGVVETIYLLTAAECGLPAFAALLTLFLSHAWLAFAALRPLRNTPQFFWAPGLLGGFTIIYLQSVLEWVLRQQVNFIELIIFFAIIGYLKKNARLLQPQPTNPSLSEPVVEPAT